MENDTAGPRFELKWSENNEKQIVNSDYFGFVREQKLKPTPLLKALDLINGNTVAAKMFLCREDGTKVPNAFDVDSSHVEKILRGSACVLFDVKISKKCESSNGDKMFFFQFEAPGYQNCYSPLFKIFSNGNQRTQMLAKMKGEPKLISIHANSAPENTNTLVFINGENLKNPIFANRRMVKFGELTTRAKICDPSTARVFTPQHPNGEVLVRLVFKEGESQSVPFSFTKKSDIESHDMIGSVTECQDEHDDLSMHELAANGYYEGLLQELISNPLNLDKADSQSCTPLHYAILYGHLSCAELLLRHGASLYKIGPWGFDPSEAIQELRQQRTTASIDLTVIDKIERALKDNVEATDTKLRSSRMERAIVAQDMGCMRALSWAVYGDDSKADIIQEEVLKLLKNPEWREFLDSHKSNFGGYDSYIKKIESGLGDSLSLLAYAKENSYSIKIITSKDDILIQPNTLGQKHPHPLVFVTHNNQLHGVKEISKKRRKGTKKSKASDDDNESDKGGHKRNNNKKDDKNINNSNPNRNSNLNFNINNNNNNNDNNNNNNNNNNDNEDEEDESTLYTEINDESIFKEIYLQCQQNMSSILIQLCIGKSKIDVGKLVMHDHAFVAKCNYKHKNTTSRTYQELLKFLSTCEGKTVKYDEVKIGDRFLKWWLCRFQSHTFESLSPEPKTRKYYECLQELEPNVTEFKLTCKGESVYLGEDNTTGLCYFRAGNLYFPSATSVAYYLLPGTGRSTSGPANLKYQGRKITDIVKSAGSRGGKTTLTKTTRSSRRNPIVPDLSSASSNVPVYVEINADEVMNNVDRWKEAHENALKISESLLRSYQAVKDAKLEYDNAKKKKLHIAFFGGQGAGKSYLLNVILNLKNTLPEGNSLANMTKPAETMFPIQIKYGPVCKLSLHRCDLEQLQERFFRYQEQRDGKHPSEGKGPQHPLEGKHPSTIGDCSLVAHLGGVEDIPVSTNDEIRKVLDGLDNELPTVAEVLALDFITLEHPNCPKDAIYYDLPGSGEVEARSFRNKLIIKKIDILYFVKRVARAFTFDDYETLVKNGYLDDIRSEFGFISGVPRIVLLTNPVETFNDNNSTQHMLEDARKYFTVKFQIYTNECVKQQKFDPGLLSLLVKFAPQYCFYMLVPKDPPSTYLNTLIGQVSEKVIAQIEAQKKIYFACKARIFLDEMGTELSQKRNRLAQTSLNDIQSDPMTEEMLDELFAEPQENECQTLCTHKWSQLKEESQCTKKNYFDAVSAQILLPLSLPADMFQVLEQQILEFYTKDEIVSYIRLKISFFMVQLQNELHAKSLYENYRVKLFVYLMQSQELCDVWDSIVNYPEKEFVLQELTANKILEWYTRLHDQIQDYLMNVRKIIGLKLRELHESIQYVLESDSTEAFKDLKQQIKAQSEYISKQIKVTPLFQMVHALTQTCADNFNKLDPLRTIKKKSLVTKPAPARTSSISVVYDPSLSGRIIRIEPAPTGFTAFIPSAFKEKKLEYEKEFNAVLEMLEADDDNNAKSIIDNHNVIAPSFIILNHDDKNVVDLDLEDCNHIGFYVASKQAAKELEQNLNEQTNFWIMEMHQDLYTGDTAATMSLMLAEALKLPIIITLNNCTIFKEWRNVSYGPCTAARALKRAQEILLSEIRNEQMNRKKQLQKMAQILKDNADQLVGVVYSLGIEAVKEVTKLTSLDAVQLASSEKMKTLISLLPEKFIDLKFTSEEDAKECVSYLPNTLLPSNQQEHMVSISNIKAALHNFFNGWRIRASIAGISYNTLQLWKYNRLSPQITHRLAEIQDLTYLGIRVIRTDSFCNLGLVSDKALSLSSAKPRPFQNNLANSLDGVQLTIMIENHFELFCEAILKERFSKDSTVGDVIIFVQSMIKKVSPLHFNDDPSSWELKPEGAKRNAKLKKNTKLSELEVLIVRLKYQKSLRFLLGDRDIYILHEFTTGKPSQRSWGDTAVIPQKFVPSPNVSNKKQLADAEEDIERPQKKSKMEEIDQEPIPMFIDLSADD